MKPIHLTIIECQNPDDVYRDASHLKLVVLPPRRSVAVQIPRPLPLKIADWCLKQATLVHYVLDQYYTARPEPDEPEMVIGRRQW